MTHSVSQDTGAQAAEGSLEVPIASLLDLAVDFWRLGTWISKQETTRTAPAARHATRRIQAFLQRLEIETVDLTGQRYEPGLAVELVETIRDPALMEGEAQVEEMILPICFHQGQVARHGQIVLRTSMMSPSSAPPHRDTPLRGDPS